MGTPQGQDHSLPSPGDPGSSVSLALRLKHAGLSPRHSLGQHFLISSRVIGRIIKASSGFDGVLEIGPGPAVLTQPLSETAKVIALELDEGMAVFAAQEAPLAEVRQMDALQADWRQILLSLPEPRGIVSNLPYQITGPLLGRCADCQDLISGCVLMMQKEVAQRILAQPGDSARGFLSVWLQGVFSIEQVCEAAPGCFLPPPKVTSTVLKFTPLPSPPTPSLLALIKQGFVQPRKTLSNNLKSLGVTQSHFEMAGILPSIRPHQLTMEQWQALHQTQQP